MGISDTLGDKFTSHGVDLQRFDGHQRGQILGLLSELEADLIAKLQAIDPTQPTRARYKKQRLERLLNEVRATISTTYKDINSTMAKEMRGFAEFEQRFVVDTVNGAAGLQIMDAALTSEFLNNIVKEGLISGAPSSEWWAKQSGNLTQSFKNEIRTGMASGESIGDMVRRIRGKATGKRHKYFDPKTGKPKWYVEFSGGIMDTGTRQAEALVRTSVQQVAADTRRELYDANADVVKGIQQISTLDGRTTPVCVAYSGASWDLARKPINGNTLPYNGGVLRHWSCRSTEIPILKTFKEIGVDLDELPPGTRSSMDGQIAADTSFDDWLGTKPEDFQNDLLGVGKAQLWRDGQITLTDLVNQRGRPLTLAELTAKHGEAQKAAASKVGVFVPSKTIAEAEAWAQARFGGKTGFDYSSSDLYTANTANRLLAEAHASKTILGPGGVRVTTGDEEFASLNDVLLIRKNQSKARARAIWDYATTRGDDFLVGFSLPQSMFMESSIHHEIGHMVRSKLDAIKKGGWTSVDRSGVLQKKAKKMSRRWSSIYNGMAESRSLPSTYAAVGGKHEGFSEMYTLYMTSKEKLPVEVIEYFDELLGFLAGVK